MFNKKMFLTFIIYVQFFKYPLDILSFPIDGFVNRRYDDTIAVCRHRFAGSTVSSTYKGYSVTVLMLNCASSYAGFC